MPHVFYRICCSGSDVWDLMDVAGDSRKYHTIFLLRVDSSGLCIGTLAWHAIRDRQAVHTGGVSGSAWFSKEHIFKMHILKLGLWCRQGHGQNSGTSSVTGQYVVVI
jgi:hypothetical protein